MGIKGPYCGIKEVKFGEMTDDGMDARSPTDDKLRQAEQRGDDKCSEHFEEGCYAMCADPEINKRSGIGSKSRVSLFGKQP